MKYKNYKSAIHNFTHSFMSIDYMKSGRLAKNVLIDLNNNGIEPKADFDFLKKTIEPKNADSKESRELMNDYIAWLPEHFDKHNCDLSGLEILQISIWTDFDNVIVPPRMNDSVELTIMTKTKWKAKDKELQLIELSQTEIIKCTYLKLKTPEMK
ncbi:MAG: hypothetical protein P1P88_12550 [Bacteroidales bacterium]|nr:hypothetical protein [Bacteroidales bacterium]